MNDRPDLCEVDEVAGGAESGGKPRSSSAPASAAASAALDPEQRGSFLGFVAHEMRNPLSTALWSAELLARLSAEDRAGPRGEKLSGMCLRSLQRLRLLVEDHFLAERLEVGGMSVRAEEVALREVVDSAREKVPAGTLHVDVGEALTAWADRGLVERAVEALLAVATRGGVDASVTGWSAGGAVGLRIAGAPAAADALEPPRKGTASDPTGRALALHMAGHVVRALGGSLSLAGDDFLLSLPSRAAELAPDPS